MNCTQTQPLLDAYADHALNAWQTFRVRRHLAGCAACAAQLADIQRVNASVHAWHKVCAPAALEGRIAAALPRTASVPMPPRNRRVARRVAVGLAGVTAAIGAGFWLLPGHPSQPTLAYADVERAMQQVQTVSWNETMIFNDRSGHPIPSTGSRTANWLRCNPPALASNGQFQDLQDKRGELLRIAPGVYGLFEPRPLGHGVESGSIAASVQATLREFTQPLTDNHFLPNSSRSHVVSSPARQQDTVLEGQKCVRFTRNEEIVATPRHGPERHYLFRVSVWADPVTRRVIRIENRNIEGGAWPNWQVTTRSNFHYNQTPPPGVFDWSPPPGSKIYHEKAALDALFKVGMANHLRAVSKKAASAPVK